MKIHVLLLFICSILPISCHIGELVDELGILRKQALFSIDEGITTIHNDSEQWKFVLEDLKTSVDKRVQQTLTYDIPQIFAKATGDATSGVLCVKDAVSEQVIYYLESIRAELLTGVPPLPPRPKICITSHNDINLNFDVNSRTTLIYYGYNLIKKDSIQAFLTTENRTREIMIPKIKIQFPTEYKFTVVLDGFTDAELSNYDYLDIRYNKVTISPITIVKKKPTLPKIQRFQIKPSDYSFIPPHTFGDKEFDGNGPKSTVNVNFYHDRNQVYYYVNMIAKETKSDWTTASGTSSKIVIFTAPIGWHIKSIIGITDYNSIISYTDSNTQPDVFGTPLGQATCIGDTQGVEAGIRTGVSFQFSYKIPIDVEENQ